ncbi:FixH family protein [Hugenholtzia roseola]|uniref:FixH family protein n=1 Tax=Hugenholtzia roseola TaxID=1002 RepID=UPI00040DE348|nr:FixH family protein [Hugenholtzia roseola]
MNWGHGIAIFYGLFMAGILSLVYLSAQENIDLVTKDYYQEEIRYQQRINQMQNAQKNPIEVVLEKQTLTLTFPQKATEEQAAVAQNSGRSGKITFFRPSDAKYDFEVALAEKGAQQIISTAKMEKGLWRAKIYWQQAGEAFYQEQTLTIK